MKLIKTLKITFSLIFGILFSSCNYVDEMDAIKSISELTEGVYFFEFFGDYDFDRFLAQGGNKTNEEMADFLTESLSKGKWNKGDVEEQKIQLGITIMNNPKLLILDVVQLLQKTKMVSQFLEEITIGKIVQLW